MAASQSEIFTELQRKEIERVILGTLDEAGARASKELKTANEAIVDAGQQLFAKTNQFKEEQDDIKEKMEAFNKDKGVILEELRAQHESFGKVREEIKGYVSMKDQMIAEVKSKCEQLDGYKVIIEQMMEKAMSIVREASGGLREEMQTNFNQIREGFQRNDEAISNLRGRLDRNERTIPQERSSGDAHQDSGHGDSGSKSLLDMRDLKIPFFPDTDSKGFLSAETFKKWTVTFGKHCGRRHKWRFAPVVFKEIRGYPNPLDTQTFEEDEEFKLIALNSKNADPDGYDFSAN